MLKTLGINLARFKFCTMVCGIF